MNPKVVTVAAASAVLLAGLVARASWNDRELVLPPVGSVEAEHLDGRPIFVTRPATGEILVLDAVSPHANLPKVLAWCEPSGLFEDLWHGSAFNADGRWFSGPAPTGMASYEILATEEDRVRVGDRLPPPEREEHVPRPVDPRRPDEAPDPNVSRCDARTALYGPSTPGDPEVLEDLVLHDPEDDEQWLYATPERILGGRSRLPADTAG